MKKETDNETIGLLLCEDKDKLTVEWSLKSINALIGVASYKVKNVIPKEIMEKLPTEEELNLQIKKLPNDEIEEENEQYFEICHWWQNYLKIYWKTKKLC